jgi:minor extracellular serine protease Vpr
MPRQAEPWRVVPLAIIAVSSTLLLVGAGVSRSPDRVLISTAQAWRGLAGGSRPQVAVGQRMLVVLKAPSLADRVAAAGGRATDKQERAWTAASLSQQRLLISRLSVQGVEIRPEYSFARVLSGFSAPLDARAVALLERDAFVQGVYPVRVAYPASISSSALERRALAESLGNADLKLPGFDGRGVTIALLDTGVERTHPFLQGGVTDGIDIVDPSGDATPQARPGSPAEFERHGTELAGILVGSRGPAAASGVAPGATVLPIRIAGWQPDATGGYSLYARTDQLIAGLERAVDPNADGDAHDVARVALVGVAAPYAGFADDPAARAVAGALHLDTLVVAPAGNDGPAGPGFGSISGPGGSPAALTVGAADMRGTKQNVRVSLRSGLDVVLDRVLPLAGAIAPARPLNAGIAAPGLARPRASFSSLDSFFSRDGLSLVAGRITLARAGSAPAAVAQNAARAGALGVLLYGPRLPAGGIPLDEDTPIPVVSIPSATAARLLSGIAAHADVGASIGVAVEAPNEDGGSVAPFSSTGLAYDGRVKPDLVAPGVEVATAEPGVAGDGSPRFGTVNGTSAAAAATAGAAAVLAQARPSLDAAALRSVLVGSARPLRGETVTSEGGGFISLGAASASELATNPVTLAFGNARSAGWRKTRELVVSNVSTRPLRVGIRIRRDAEGAAAVRFAAFPSHFTLAAGASRRVRLEAHVASALTGRAPAEGTVVVIPRGGSPLYVPWAVTFGPPPKTLLGPLHLSTASFTPSESAPALLTFQAGRILNDGGRDEVQPVALLQLELVRGDGTDLGTLVRLRDLLPGRYAFGLTGRSPAGSPLGRGRYVVEVVAVPSLPGPASRSKVAFTIK